MDRLTTNQIQDFNNPLAFARGRELDVGQKPLASLSKQSLRTGGIEESYRLVTGAAERLETLAGNLETMRDLAESGRRIRGDERKLKEVYGKLRSLSAGFDQVVEAIRFDGTTVFDGKTLALDLGPGTRPLSIEASKLLTYGTDSLDLSQSDPTAEISLRYGVDDKIVNQAYTLVGLEIEEASFLPGSNAALELEDGDYKIKVAYLGADSTVEIHDREGALIERQAGVDLSGSGREWVDFDLGLRLSFAKEQILQSFDKYDFESNGPAYLTASMAYRRLDSHTLRTGPDDDTADGVAFPFSPELRSAGGGSLRADRPQLAPIEPGKTPLASGSYTVDIEYLGENSYARLSDGLGRLQGYKFDLDLSTEGRTEIDFGVGFSFEIENKGFSGRSRLSVPVDYTKKPAPIDDFDFAEYTERIEQAMEVVRVERVAMQDAIAAIEEANNLRNTASNQSVPNARTLAGAGALNILAAPSDIGGSIFDLTEVSARTGLLANQLFATTTAFPAQANQSPEELASLQRASAGDYLGSFV